MKKLSIIFMICILSNAEAVLPPLYQTSNEIKSIMSDKQLGQKLQSGEVIERIEKNDQGYEIITNKSTMQIVVKYIPPKQPGPLHYTLVFEEPKPLSEPLIPMSTK